MTEILIILLCVGQAVAVTLLTISRNNWRDRCEHEETMYNAAIEQILASDSEAQEAVLQKEFVQAAFKRMLERPIVVGMTDAQVSQLAEGIAQLIGQKT